LVHHTVLILTIAWQGAGLSTTTTQFDNFDACLTAAHAITHDIGRGTVMKSANASPDEPLSLGGHALILSTVCAPLDGELKE
jgi:hypothetical protein